jgi:transposase
VPSYKREGPVVIKPIVYGSMDVHKETIEVALARLEPPAPVESLGQILNRPEAIRRLMQPLAQRYQLRMCYEAGPCGYAIYRQLRAMGIDCTVVAPSLIPRRPGDRIKTDRRDARKLAHLFRSGELTAVWVPDPTHEALHNLTRLRACAHHDRTRARHRLSKLTLRAGRIPPPGMRSWSERHRAWIAAQPFEQPLDTLVRDDYLTQVEHLEERVRRLDQVIEQASPSSPLAARIAAFGCMRGIATVTAATLVAECSEIGRFQRPRQLMAYTGLVPSESSSGARASRGRITKTGSSYLRRILCSPCLLGRPGPIGPARGGWWVREGNEPDTVPGSPPVDPRAT